MRLADEAAAGSGVCLAIQNRLQQLGVIRRVILKVGILHDQQVASGQRPCVAQGGTFALVGGLVEDFEGDVGEVGGDLLHHVPCAVLGGVIDHDDFAGKAAREGLIDDALDDCREVAFLVIDGNEDGEGLVDGLDGGVEDDQRLACQAAGAGAGWGGGVGAAWSAIMSSNWNRGASGIVFHTSRVRNANAIGR